MDTTKGISQTSSNWPKTNGDNLIVQQKIQNNYSKDSQENKKEQYKKIRKTI